MTDPVNPTALVVDDAADSLSLISDALEQAGLDTLVALEGKQALTIARRIRPDIILLDALMPQLDGFETCLRLKADPQLAHIPVIFMTGLADSDSIVKGLQAGGVDYLTKPVDTSELVARVRVHLKNAQITFSAQKALDSTGQNIFTVDATGRILWATPHALALFATANADELWRENVLGPRLASWLARRPEPQAVFPLDAASKAISISLIEALGNGESLLRVSEASGLSGEEQLRQALKLTARESEVLYWLASGKTNKDISQILGMGVRTVNKHLEQIFPKLGVENRTAAAGIAIRQLH